MFNVYTNISSTAVNSISSKFTKQSEVNASEFPEKILADDFFPVLRDY